MKTYLHGGRQTMTKIQRKRIAFCIVVFGFFIGNAILKAAEYEEQSCLNDAQTSSEATHMLESADKHSEAYIRQRILEIYEFNVDRELYYTSKAYYELWWRMKRKDDRVDGLLGLFDYDHWTQAQDVVFGAKVVYVEIITWTKALAVVDVNDSEINFPLVFEEGDWFIDDFLTEYDGRWRSEKKLMKEYVYGE